LGRPVPRRYLQRSPQAPRRATRPVICGVSSLALAMIVAQLRVGGKSALPAFVSECSGQLRLGGPFRGPSEAGWPPAILRPRRRALGLTQQPRTADSRKPGYTLRTPLMHIPARVCRLHRGPPEGRTGPKKAEGFQCQLVLAGAATRHAKVKQTLRGFNDLFEV